MLYYFLEYINKTFNPPGFDVFRFLTFRSALAAISALLISLLFAPRIIRLLQKKPMDPRIIGQKPVRRLWVD